MWQFAPQFRLQLNYLLVLYKAGCANLSPFPSHGMLFGASESLHRLGTTPVYSAVCGRLLCSSEIQLKRYLPCEAFTKVSKHVVAPSAVLFPLSVEAHFVQYHLLVCLISHQTITLFYTMSYITLYSCVQ